jgi:O-antigen biosynthesis protein WbqP
MRDPAAADAVRGLALRAEAEDAAHDLWRSAFKRLFDIALALPVCLLATPLLVLLGILVRATSRGPAFYWSMRVGRDNRLIPMPKLRTMRNGAPEVATHLFDHAEQFLTPIGGFLRRSSLDELPQIFSILTGEMSFVGPRPALFNQDDLVELRARLGIQRLTPGLTGWAQVNGRDRLSLEEKVRFDAEYLEKQSFWFDLRILIMTIGNVLARDGVNH